ncbi:MAG: HAMP domain-containing histidine kinase [bacterium]|nr:HAMP domain-containing histidine kinase [bacterium]
MLKTLYAKLSLWLVLLLTAIGLLYGFISNYALQQHLQQIDQQLNQNLAQALVADRNLVKEGAINEAALKKTFDLYMTINPSIEIYLLNLHGEIISYSADPKKIKRKKISLQPIRAFLAMEKPYPLLGDDPRDHVRQKAFSVTPVPSQEKPEGYLYVVLRGEQYAKAERLARDGFLLQSGLWALLISLGIGLLAGLMVFGLLTRRLRKLSQSIEHFERSGFTDKISFLDKRAGRTDEIDQLGASFDHMAIRISDQLDTMNEQDHLRRRLVAQVSHDLRTPLASIQGYLESLQLKEHNLTVQQRAELVEVALRQGKRLSRMVEELFELAGLDARERSPNLEPCSVSELTHDVVQKYSVRAQQHSVDLQIEASTRLPLASVDIPMLERVFDNLIDNALAHTPADGHIKVSLAPLDDTLQITISNSGKGIPANDLPHVFEPFFQGESGSANPNHAGLGLAIAKRIMELLHGNITVTSTEGQGTKFTLQVPITLS